MIPLSERASDIDTDRPAPGPAPGPRLYADPGVIARMLGRFVPQRRAAHRDERSPPWGEGLVEQSIVSLGYGATWSTVDRDELVFLWPALAHPSAGGNADGAAPFLAELLAELTGHDAGVTDGPISSRDAMLAAIRSGIHPAYARPELACMHEALTAGAWLAHLVAGRDAWLPPVIAGPVVELLQSATPAAARPPDPAADVMAAFAEAAVGVRRLTRIARAVARGGSPRLVRPSAGRGIVRNRGA